MQKFNVENYHIVCIVIVLTWSNTVISLRFLSNMI